MKGYRACLEWYWHGVTAVLVGKTISSHLYPSQSSRGGDWELTSGLRVAMSEKGTERIHSKVQRSVCFVLRNAIICLAGSTPASRPKAPASCAATWSMQRSRTWGTSCRCHRQQGSVCRSCSWWPWSASTCGRRTTSSRVSDTAQLNLALTDRFHIVATAFGG